jgi:outer membrane lipase/esterase
MKSGYALPATAAGGGGLCPGRLASRCCAALVALAWHVAAQAQSAPSLVQMVTTLTQNGTYKFDALEYDAAVANDAAYARLLPICGAAAPATAGCTGNTQTLFNQLRALEDNADQFLGRGETTYSLQLSPQGLGAALRWTAPEEYAAQGSVATRFANSQASVLTSRFAALRFATQLRVARGLDGDDDTDVASLSPAPLGGSAGADNVGSFGRLSVFANGSFGTGTKDPTTFEDAFSFDDTEASVGADYRLSAHWLVGLMAGHTEKRVDFNSELSIVSGFMRGNGQSVLVYGQYDGDAFYANGSFGIQHLSLNTLRKITYPSNNPIVPSVNDTAYSDTGAQTLTGTLAAGYTFHYRAFSAEPYLSGQYAKVRINSFTEHSAEGFDFDVGEQGIHEAEIAAGLKFQYAFLPPFGVIVPYVYAEYRHEFADASRTIDSTYSASLSDAPQMTIPTDAAPNHYYVVGGGGSIVLPHGIQGFMQYLRVLDYTDYSDHVVSGGLRWEF